MNLFYAWGQSMIKRYYIGITVLTLTVLLVGCNKNVENTIGDSVIVTQDTITIENL